MTSESPGHRVTAQKEKSTLQTLEGGICESEIILYWVLPTEIWGTAP